MNKHQTEGIGKKISGTAKDLVGKVTGDRKLQGEGKIEKGIGKVQKKVGDIQDGADRERDRTRNPPR